MNSYIVRKIKSLPPLPKSLIEIEAVCNRSDTTINELVKIIQNDPMIVANLLKSANSPLYGFGREIISIHQSVSLFGINMTRSIAMSTSIKKLFKINMDAYNVSSDEFAEISFKQAKLILNWFKKINPPKKDKLFLAALLQETGKIIISDMIIQNGDLASFKDKIKNSNNIAEIENSFIKDTTATVTAEIFRSWNLDEMLIDMIFHSDNPKNAPKSIQQYAYALNIVKSAIPINAPLAKESINTALIKAEEAGFDKQILEDEINIF